MSIAPGGVVTGATTALRHRPEVADAPQPDDHDERRRERWHPVVVFAVVAAAVFLIAALSVELLPRSKTPGNWRVLRDNPLLAGWARWDAGWYWWIARHGYFLDETRQSPVAFFPGYPLVLQVVSPFTGGPILAGILVTASAGLGAVVLFYRWCIERLGTKAARTAIWVLVLYPFAYYLVGAVYADAMYLVAAIGAFILLERGHPALAGLVGAVATATRPVGYALVLGLVLRSFELRRRARAGGGHGGELARTATASTTSRWDRWRPAGVLLSVGGLAGYAGWLWYRFGNPLAFISAQAEWGQPPGWESWSKQAAWRALSSFEFDLFHQRILVHAGLAVVAIALLPAVVRRLGWAYGAYAAATILVPTLTSADFVGLGRYMLAAFPCFAVAGMLLSERPRLRVAVLGASGAGLVVFTSLFARWHYVS